MTINNKTLIYVPQAGDLILRPSDIDPQSRWFLILEVHDEQWNSGTGVSCKYLNVKIQAVGNGWFGFGVYEFYRDGKKQEIWQT